MVGQAFSLPQTFCHRLAAAIRFVWENARLKAALREAEHSITPVIARRLT